MKVVARSTTNGVQGVAERALQPAAIHTVVRLQVPNGWLYRCSPLEPALLLFAQTLEFSSVNDLFVGVTGVHTTKPQIDHDVFDLEAHVLCRDSCLVSAPRTTVDQCAVAPIKSVTRRFQGNRREIQRFMRFIFRQIKAFNAPTKFSQGAALCERIVFTWPDKFIALQALLPQAKSVAMPVQRFDLVVMAIGEDVQRAGKGVQSEFLLDQDAQAVDGFSEVDGFAVQVDLLDGTARMHQRPPWTQRAKAVSHWGSGNAGISRRMPVPSTRVQLVAIGRTA